MMIYSGKGEVTISPSGNGGFIISVSYLSGRTEVTTSQSHITEAFTASTMDEAMILVREQLEKMI